MSVFSSFINIPRKILLFIKLIIGSNPGLTGPIVVYIIGEVVFHITSFIIHVLTALNSSQLLAVHVLTGGSDQSDSRL